MVSPPPVPAQDGSCSPYCHSTFIIGIGGGSASGKTSVSERIINGISLPNVVLISMDSFYRVLTPEQSQQARQNRYNFDCPESFDFDLLVQVLSSLKQGRSVEIPTYDFVTHSRTKETQVIPANTSVVVFEGIMALHDERILKLLDLRVFVHTDDDIRLARRLLRDIKHRGRECQYVIDMYFRYAKPGHDSYVEPSSKVADVIVPRGAENVVAIDLLVKRIKGLLA